MTATRQPGRPPWDFECARLCTARRECIAVPMRSGDDMRRHDATKKIKSHSISKIKIKKEMTQRYGACFMVACDGVGGGGAIRNATVPARRPGAPSTRTSPRAQGTRQTGQATRVTPHSGTRS